MGEKENTKNKSLNFIHSLHQAGRMFTIAAICLIALVPVVYCLSAKTTPDWAMIGKAFMFILSYWAIGLIEAISYAPILGVGGQYQAFITGNVSNLKLPCSLNVQNILNTQNGTEEQEIIATIAISVSSIVTTLIIIIGLIPLAIFSDKLVTALQPVSPYVMPAIFGGLGLVLLSKYFKLTIVPFAIMIVVMLALFLLDFKLEMSTALTVGMVVAVISGFVIYKNEKKKRMTPPKNNSEQQNSNDSTLQNDDIQQDSKDKKAIKKKKKNKHAQTL